MFKIIDFTIEIFTVYNIIQSFYIAIILIQQNPLPPFYCFNPLNLFSKKLIKRGKDNYTTAYKYWYKQKRHTFFKTSFHYKYYINYIKNHILKYKDLLKMGL